MKVRKKAIKRVNLIIMTTVNKLTILNNLTPKILIILTQIQHKNQNQDGLTNSRIVIQNQNKMQKKFKKKLIKEQNQQRKKKTKL